MRLCLPVVKPLRSYESSMPKVAVKPACIARRLGASVDQLFCLLVAKSVERASSMSSVASLVFKFASPAEDRAPARLTQ